MTLLVSPLCQLESLMRVGMSIVEDPKFEGYLIFKLSLGHTFQDAIMKRLLYVSFGYCSN